MKPLTIVTYHYVRELPYTRYPQIKGLLVSDFAAQLAYFEKYYHFVTIAECLAALTSPDADFPDRAILLTFDDGYIDHFTTVFPLLEERRIQGCFFPSAQPILRHAVLDVNKLHFILASAPDTNALLQQVYACLDAYREAYALESNQHYFSKFAQPSRFGDPAEVMLIKRLLQNELPEPARKLILNELFRKYVTQDEAAFAQELYVTVEQLRCMQRNGMYIGGHGDEHHRLDRVSQELQQQEIEETVAFLRLVGAPTTNWVFSYPSGTYNDAVLALLKQQQCALAVTTKFGVAELCPENALFLDRLDTNEFPKKADSIPNDWTKKIMMPERNLC